MDKPDALLIALMFACTGAPAQTLPQPQGYAGYPGTVPAAPPHNPDQPEVLAVPEPSPVTTSSGPSLPGQADDTGLGVPQVEVHRFPGMHTKPLSPPAPMARFAPVTENGVTYLCGGVGLDEAEQMKREASSYDLMLTFAARNGSYLADVNVDVADASGKSLMRTTCGAPMMLVDLPKAGAYRIHAETGGHTLTRSLRLQGNERGKRITMVWPQGPSTRERLSN